MHTFSFCISQLPSLSPWSSKEETVQTSSLSSVDTVRLERSHCGYTMEQWRVVNSLPQPSQCIYTVLTRTEHTTTITWVDCSVQALDGYLILCAYEIPGNFIQSNVAKFSLIPHGHSWSILAVLDCALVRLHLFVQLVFALCGPLQRIIVVILYIYAHMHVLVCIVCVRMYICSYVVSPFQTITRIQ